MNVNLNAMATSQPTATAAPKKPAKAGRKPAAKKSAKGLNKDTYTRSIREMYLLRKYEARTGQLYIQLKIGGYCQKNIGQEAVLSGMREAIRPTDRVITAYRDHAHPLVLGTDPKFVMAEMFGRKTGTCKG